MFNREPPTGWVAISAGTAPAGEANPRTARMLQERGLPVPNHPPQALTAEMIEASRIRVTMGCLDKASCPARLNELEYRDWSLPDPAQLDDQQFREVRDRLEALVVGLVNEIRLHDHQPAARVRPT
jgi:arsenate reductase